MEAEEKRQLAQVIQDKDQLIAELNKKLEEKWGEKEKQLVKVIQDKNQLIAELKETWGEKEEQLATTAQLEREAKSKSRLEVAKIPQDQDQFMNEV